MTDNTRQPMLSAEEYAAKQKQERTEIFQMLDDATREVLVDPKQFNEYLDMQSRLHRYTVSNNLLIYKQCPNAVQLKDFNEWAEQGVRINKGAKAVRLLEPEEYTKKDGTTAVGYRIKNVFDVSQTNGKLPAQKTVPDITLAAVILDTAPVRVESVKDTSETGYSYYDREQQTLYVRESVGDSTELVQNLAFQICAVQLLRDYGDRDLSKEDIAFEARSAAYMLCRRFGASYQKLANITVPQSWQEKPPKEIRAELSKVKNICHDVASRVETELHKRQQERSGQNRDAR